MADLPTLIPSADAVPFPDAAVAGELVLTGGQVPALDPLAPDFETQARQAMAALERTLAAAGASLESVLRLECFLADREHFGAWNAAYDSCFGARRPPRTTLISGFVIPGLMIEVQAVAVVSGA
jgi:2-iminobutanoate/2-iminopropanoate deaminase